MEVAIFILTISSIALIILAGYFANTIATLRWELDVKNRNIALLETDVKSANDGHMEVLSANEALVRSVDFWQQENSRHYICALKYLGRSNELAERINASVKPYTRRLQWVDSTHGWMEQWRQIGKNPVEFGWLPVTDVLPAKKLYDEFYLLKWVGPEDYVIQTWEDAKCC